MSPFYKTIFDFFVFSFFDNLTSISNIYFTTMKTVSSHFRCGTVNVLCIHWLAAFVLSYDGGGSSVKSVVEI